MTPYVMSILMYKTIRISVLRQTVENALRTWCKQVTF